MLKRNREVLLWLDEKEYEQLHVNAKKCGLSIQRYLRKLLDDIQPVELPHADYYEVLKNLRQINVNMNQIAVKANTNGFIDVKAYWENVRNLQEIYSLLKT